MNSTNKTHTLSFIFPFLLKERFLLIKLVVVAGAIAVISAVLPYFLKLQLDQLEQQNNLLSNFPVGSLQLFFLLLFIPVMLELVSRIFFEPVDMTLRDGIRENLRERVENVVWKKVNTLDAGFFQSKRNIKIFNDAMRSSLIVNDALHFFVRRFSSTLLVVTIFPLLALVDWRIVLLVFIVAFGQFLISQVINNKKKGYTIEDSNLEDERWKYWRLLSAYYFEIKTLGNVTEIINSYSKVVRKQAFVSTNRYKKDLFLEGVNWSLDNLLILATNMFVGYQVFTGEVSIGSFVLVVGYTKQISIFFTDLIDSFSQWSLISFDLYRLNFFLSLQSRIKSSGNVQSIPSHVDSVSLAKVDFSYPDYSEDENKYLESLAAHFEKRSGYFTREIVEIKNILSEKVNTKPVLKSVDFKIEKGNIIALVGRNGSGKTTLTHILQHHFEPTSGDVFLGDTEIYQFKQEQLHKQFAWLTQHPFILDRFSVKDNMLFGTKGTKADMERMAEITKKLGLDAVISGMPNGIETILGDEASLSGGQEQLVAIARALVQQRPFIIFDEGSSQLDLEKETQVLKLLQEEKKNKAILFITHRMSVARKADYIYVIDEGKIIEKGTHSELLRNKKLYADFWKLQMLN